MSFSLGFGFSSKKDINSFALTDISGLVLNLDASDESTITEGATFTWADKSGQGNDVSQSTASYQPLTGTGTIGGLNALEFNNGGVASRLKRNDSCGLASGAPAFTIFAVHRADKGDQNFVLYLGDSAAAAGKNIRVSAGNNGSSYRFGNGNLFYNPNFSGAGISVWQGEEDEVSANYDFYKNGGAPVTPASGTGSSTVPLNLGTGGCSVGADLLNDTGRFEGAIGEIAVYARALTAAEMNKVGNCLAAKWGLSWTDV